LPLACHPNVVAKISDKAVGGTCSAVRHLGDSIEPPG
jgi:hypothetical protein